MIHANLQLTDYDAQGRPSVNDLSVLSSPLTALLTQEIQGAAEALGLSSDVIIVAALGRAIQRVIGEGIVTVDVPGYGTCVHPVTVRCSSPDQLPADDMLVGVHDALDALTIHHIVHGVPDHSDEQPVADVLFTSGEASLRCSHLGHVLELRARVVGDTLALDWWFDARSFESYTVQELAEQLPLAIIELSSEAAPPVRATALLAVAH